MLVGDVFWRAVSEDGTEIPKGAVVSITGQDGTTLKVKVKMFDIRREKECCIWDR